MIVAASLASAAVIAAAIALHDLVAMVIARRDGRRKRRAVNVGRRLVGAIAASRPVRRLSPSARLNRLLIAAGEPGGLSAMDWLAIQVTGGTGALAMVALAGVGGAGRLGLALLICAPAAGFLAPDLWLSRRARRRAEAAVRQLPDMLDLFCVTVEAGLPPARALALVGGEFDGPLAREWRCVSAELTLGVAGEEAWRALGDRLAADEVRLLADAFTRSNRHGVPLARVLADQASRARHRRRQRVRERAARAGPKIQLVVALLLVPSVLLIVAAAAATELQNSGLALLS